MMASDGPDAAPPGFDVVPTGDRPAVFLDRDGVLNDGVPDPDTGELESPLRPRDVRLRPGAAAAARALAGAGYALVCVSNQPAAAKGKTTVPELQVVHERVLELLAREGVRLDASYLCHHHPQGRVPELSGPCACRKPAPGMLLAAARDLGLRLGASWMVGDTDADMAAGGAAGCRTVLVEYPGSAHKRGDAAAAARSPVAGAPGRSAVAGTAGGSPVAGAPERPLAAPDLRVPDLAAAAPLLLTQPPPLLPPVCILAGGLGTRLGERVRDTPKPLLEVAGEPFLHHQLRLLAAHGAREVVVCVGYLGELIEQRVGARRFGLHIAYCYDAPGLDGTLGAIRRARALLGERFLVLYGDTYLRVDYAAAAQAWRTSGLAGLMCVLRNEGRWDTSNAVYVDGRVVTYDKRAPPRTEMLWIDYGLGGLHQSALDLVAPQARDLAELYSQLAREGQLCGYEAHERFYEIGTPRGLAETEAFLRGLGSAIRPSGAV
jgi:histidinol-phosphate phosphatase family protein